MTKDTSELKFLNIGDTIINSYILATFFNYQERKIKSKDYVFSVMKLVEAIVLHEKLYSSVININQDIYDEIMDSPLMGNVFYPVPGESFFQKKELLWKHYQGSLVVSEIDDINSKLFGKIEYLFFQNTGLSYTTIDAFSNYQSYQNHSLNLTAEEAQKKIKDKNKFVVNNHFSLDVPLIFNYVVQNSSSFEDMIKQAFELRNTTEAITFRKMSESFEYSMKKHNDDKNDDSGYIMDEMTVAASKLIERTSLPKSVPITTKITISYPLKASVTIGAGINTDDITKALKIGQKHHLLFISRLYDTAIRSHSATKKFLGFLDKIT